MSTNKKNINPHDLEWARNRLNRVLEALSLNIILTDRGFTPKYLCEMDLADLVRYVHTLQHISLLPEEQRRKIILK